MYYHIDSLNETRTLKATEGQLYRITINKRGLVGSLITLYDGTTTSDPVIAVLDTNNCDSYLEYDLAFSFGLTYKTEGTPGDLTINYQ